MPDFLRHFPIKDLDISKSTLRILDKLGYVELDDLDSLSYGEFRRYIRSFPNTNPVIDDIAQAVDSLRLNSSRVESLLTATVSYPSSSKGPPDSLRDAETQEVSSVEPIEDSTETEFIYIPSNLRGHRLANYDMSVRLTNVLRQANLRLVGDLHGHRFADFGKCRNFGAKTLTELREFVRRLQSSIESTGAPLAEPSESGNVLAIPQIAQELRLVELPMSVRLENALQSRGYKILGELRGLDLHELLGVKNFGRKCAVELLTLIRSAAAGEFSASDPDDVTSSLNKVASLIDVGLDRLPSRDLKIVEERLSGNHGHPRTLEDVGRSFNITRERVRQIVKVSVSKIRRQGGPKLVRALEVVARECEQGVYPLTAELFGHWLGNQKRSCRYQPEFYVRILDVLEPSIPAWPPGSIREAADSTLTLKIEQALEHYLRENEVAPSAKEAYTVLRRQPDLRNLSIGTFLSSLRRGGKIVVDLPEPYRPELRLRQVRMRIPDFASAILQDSSEPLTPEAIITQAKRRYGEDAIAVSSRTAGNALALDPQFYLLGPRSFGLRKHFGIPEPRWSLLRDKFARLLKDENRPISTIELVKRQTVAGFAQANSCEMAEIIRQDPRFIDLGRQLFGLADWGVQEREKVNDLVPRVFEEAKRALTIQQTLVRMTRLRSVSPNTIANILQKHPAVRRLGFGYYGLKKWGSTESEIILMSRDAVHMAVRRATPPVTFGQLCTTFGIPAEGRLANMLWKACSSSPNLRRAPERQDVETLLLHKATSLEQILANIARALQRPAPAYELEWELRTKFGKLFDKVRLSEIEERLSKSPLFLRNAAGEFVLDEELDLQEFDVDGLRSASVKALLESRDVAATSELLERLERQGLDLAGLSSDMLASILRGARELQEVGHHRFRTR